MRNKFNILLLLLIQGCSYNSDQKQETANSELSHSQRYDRLMQHALPGDADINSIENKIVSNPCIGSIDRWQREYFYSASFENLEVRSDLIEFIYKEVGRFNFESKVVKVNAFGSHDLDDRSYKVVFGSYNITNNEVTVEYCGPNR